MTPKREIWTALALVFGATFLLAIIQAVFPFTAGFMQVGLALVLLEVPPWILRKRQPDGPLSPDREGLFLRIGPARQGLALGLGTAAIVFPIFIAGFHLTYTELLGRPADWNLRNLSRWSETLEYAPPAPCQPTHASLWTQDDSAWITAPTRSAITVRLDSPHASARTILCRGATPTLGAPLTPDADGLYRPKPGVGIRFELGQATDLDISIFEQNAPIASDRLRLSANASSSADGRVESTRDLTWLIVYLLIHLGLVAWPEEYFFRGYLLPRLDQRFPRRWRLFGVPVGMGLVLSSLAFALLHPILIPGPHRLLVFFPAFLFGWLALKQRNLGAAILVHALSNLCLAIVSRMYA
jgi:membrane protease YdiL (CAAX protease family)